MSGSLEVFSELFDCTIDDGFVERLCKVDLGVYSRRYTPPVEHENTQSIANREHSLVIVLPEGEISWKPKAVCDLVTVCDRREDHFACFEEIETREDARVVSAHSFLLRTSIRRSKIDERSFFRVI